MKLIIDPPQGWLYGYPDIWDDEKETLSNNLERHGYPKEHIEFACEYLWMTEVKDEDK